MTTSTSSTLILKGDVTDLADAVRPATLKTT
jgi:hypothetical protein